MEQNLEANKIITLPGSALADLDFNGVLERIAEMAISQDAKMEIIASPIWTSIDRINQSLDRLQEFYLLSQQSAIEFCEYNNISIILRNLRIEGFVLSIEDIIALKDVLINVEQVIVLVQSKPAEMTSLIRKDISVLEDISIILTRIRKTFAKDNTIVDHASEALEQIRKKIRSKQAEVYKTFKRIVQQLKNKNVLAEGEESIRNGRLVLRLLAEHRRALDGIIHDESDGGRTVFLEPREVVELNNELFELESEERKEILRILKALCQFLRPLADQVQTAFNSLVQWDILLAKSKFSAQLEAIKPQLNTEGLTKIDKASHPILLIKSKKSKKEVIPCSFYLNEKNRIIIISGPNAGGKSIVLKTFGLLQIMVQAGLMVPVGKTSSFRIFNKIFAEIGDHQSMDDELSTYSAKLSNMRDFLEQADQHTLILIDEFGSGTEPKIGGAIAESVLYALNKKKVTGMINTHYSNIKVFAHKTDGLINASMLFDIQSLRPTYQLKVGQPGSSYALEIAEKIKLPLEIINLAKEKAGDQSVSFENLLTTLDKEINKLKFESNEVKLKQVELDKLIRSYSQMNKQYEYKKLKLRMEQKQMEVQTKSNKQKEINAYIKELRSEKNIEKLVQKAESEKQKLDHVADEFVQMNHELHAMSSPEANQEILEGDTVKMIFSGMFGKVIKVEKGRYHVATNHMTFNMKANELLRVNHAVEVNTQQSIQSNVERHGAAINTVLDIRGMRLQEAQEKIDLYMDRALLANVNRVYIVHGIGNGILKRNLAKTLRQLSFVKDFHHPDEENGGQGTTVIDFR